MDYQLDRLSTRSFEQLVQAISLKVIGPAVMVFGDGPDNGREATFDGKIKYPNSRAPWNGYGIIQAKFRQVPDNDSRKNSEWAVERLKLELEKFAPQRKRAASSTREERIAPDYFIFATNVPLTPVAKKGGKDRVRSVLEAFKATHGLKDYAIWDADQISRYLDGNNAIRTSYAAWVLPGDVLSEMMKSLKPEKSDFEKVMRRYLECELLDDQYAKLSQGGYTDAKHIPLGHVFVDLPLEVDRLESPFDEDENEDTERDRLTFLRYLFDEGRHVLRPSTTERQKSTSGHRPFGRIVLIGGPGQGKTTVGQFACHLLRSVLLRTAGGLLSPEVSQAIERVEEMADGVAAIGARRYPLRVDLKQLAAALAANGAAGCTNLFDFFVKRISDRASASLNPADFRRWLGLYPWMLVLDGLDEVPASSNRHEVMQAIRDFVSVEAHEADADLLVLATTRPQGYSDDFDPTLYNHVTLAPLSPADALTYGKRLASARHPNQTTRIEELVGSLKLATQNAATVRLMQSPLQVTIMLALVEGGGSPPEQRWKLFHEYYQVIYKREKERATPFSKILGRFEPDFNWIHHRVGWILQQRNSSAGKTDAKLSHEEFAAIVDERLAHTGHQDTPQRTELVSQIRAAATDRLVFLVGTRENEIGFEIRSLQEFMAAEHLFDGGEACVQKTLHAIAPYAYWRNVFLFAAGRVFFDRQELIDSVIAICQSMNDDPDDPWQRAVFSGSRLALAVLRDGAARNQPAHTRVLARCSSRILDSLHEEDSSAVAELLIGEGREVWEEELCRRLVSAPGRFSSANWAVGMRLVGMGKVWAQKAMEDDFPWRGEEAMQFVDYVQRNRQVVPDVFWREFLKHSLAYSFRWVITFLQTDRPPRPVRDSWLGSLIPLLHDRAAEWPLSLGNRVETDLCIRVHATGSLKLWAEVDLPKRIDASAHPDWHIAAAIAAFAREPTHRNLARQLERVAGVGEPSVIWFCPWQFAVAYEAHYGGVSWDAVCKHVAKGGFGTASDWQRWEAEGAKGIRLSQFQSDGLTITRERLGILLRNSAWMAGSLELAASAADEFASALVKWPSLRQQASLMGLCCYSFFKARNAEAGSFLPRLERFVDVCSEHAIPVTEIVPLAVVTSSLPVEDRLRLLEKIGRCSIRAEWVPEWDRDQKEEEDRVREIVGKLVGLAKPWKSLLALSYLPPLEALRLVPESVLGGLAAQGGQSETAAIVLRLNSLRWGDDVGTLVDSALRLMSTQERRELIDRLFRFIELNSKVGQELEQFALLLMNRGVGDLQVRAAGVLVRLIDRRPPVAQLPDPYHRVAVRG